MMFGRIVEVMLGCWLVLSPFVFRHPDARVEWWANDLACGTAAIVLAFLSYWRPLRYAHVVTLLVGAWLAAHAAVAWVEVEAPWDIERHLLSTLSLPLNIEENAAHPFCAELRQLRSHARERCSRGYGGSRRTQYRPACCRVHPCLDVATVRRETAPPGSREFP